MSYKNRKIQEVPDQYLWSLHSNRSFCSIVLWIVVSASCIICSGCHPAAFVAGAFLLDYLDDQVQNNNRLIDQQARKSPPKIVHFDRKQYSQPVPDKPKTTSSPVPDRPKTTRSPVQQVTGSQIITKAIRSYDSLDWNEAERLFYQALEKNDISNFQKWKLWVFLGAIAYQQGNLSEAQSCFINAARQDSGKIPSSELFPPQMIKFYKSVGRK